MAGAAARQGERGSAEPAPIDGDMSRDGGGGAGGAESPSL